jgi:hypothetical protein
MGKKIKPPADLIEMAAALEVAKSIAFHALVTAVANCSGITSEVANGLKTNALVVLANAELDMSSDDAKRYRAYAEATIEELFGRLHTDEGPLNPKAS